VLAELHIRSEICAIVTYSGQFACSVTFRHNLPLMAKTGDAHAISQTCSDYSDAQTALHRANAIDEGGVKIGEGIHSRCVPDVCGMPRHVDMHHPS
jgi:hypothetical protein